jgi:hypothetical protein
MRPMGLACAATGLGASWLPWLNWDSVLLGSASTVPGKQLKDVMSSGPPKTLGESRPQLFPSLEGSPCSQVQVLP